MSPRFRVVLDRALSRAGRPAWFVERIASDSYDTTDFYPTKTAAQRAAVRTWPLDLMPERTR